MPAGGTRVPSLFDKPVEETRMENKKSKVTRGAPTWRIIPVGKWLIVNACVQPFLVVQDFVRKAVYQYDM